jgi:hypothetical protein
LAQVKQENRGLPPKCGEIFEPARGFARFPSSFVALHQNVEPSALP